jgi:hypothetical protein
LSHVETRGACEGVPVSYNANPEDDEAGGPEAAPEGETVPTGTLNCSNCGAENDADFVYCQNCAQRL